MAAESLGSLVGVGAGYAIFSNATNSIFRKLPGAGQVIEYFYPKPNAVIVSQSGPIFRKLENFIVNKYLESIRSCQLAPRNGEITFSLEEIKLHQALTDQYQDQEVQLSLIQPKGDNPVNSFKSLFWNFEYDNSSANNQQINREKSIVISSWKLSVKQLKDYVTQICDFKKSTKITRMFSAVQDHIPSNNSKKKRDSADDSSAILEWEEIHVKTNKRLTNTIVSQSVEENLLGDLKWFMESESWYNNMGLPYQRGYVLHGPPGTGKTSLIKSIAAEYQLSIFIIDLEIVKTNAQFSSLMKKINYLCKNKPYILALEDIDRSPLFINKHRYYYDSPKDKISLGCFLNEIDGLVESHGRILFLTANDIDPLKKVDQNALMRPGRIDRLVKIDYCDFDQIQRLLIHFYGLEHSDTLRQLSADHLKIKQISPADLINLLQSNMEKPLSIVLSYLFNQHPLNDDQTETKLVIPSSVNNSSDRSRLTNPQIVAWEKKITQLNRRISNSRRSLNYQKRLLSHRADQTYWEKLEKQINGKRRTIDKSVQTRNQLKQKILATQKKLSNEPPKKRIRRQ